MSWENSFNDYNNQAASTDAPQQIQYPNEPQIPYQPMIASTQIQNDHQPSNLVPMLSEDDLEQYIQSPKYKTYIITLITIIIVYFILSLDVVKSSIGKVLTCINQREDGTVSKTGYFAYGMLLSIICVIVIYMGNKYITIDI